MKIWYNPSETGEAANMEVYPIMAESNSTTELT